MAKKTAVYSMFLALILVLGLVENAIPIAIGVPGIKLGLSNVVLLFALYYFGVIPAFALMGAKVLLLAFLTGRFTSFAFGLSGGILSVISMALCFKVFRLDIVATSVVGACFHIFAQIAVASLVLQTKAVAFYLPVLIISAVITGLLTGFAAKATTKAIDKSNINLKFE